MTFVVVDGWTVTVASVGDSRCILVSQEGEVTCLTVDHRLEVNAEELRSFPILKVPPWIFLSVFQSNNRRL